MLVYVKTVSTLSGLPYPVYLYCKPTTRLRLSDGKYLTRLWIGSYRKQKAIQVYQYIDTYVLLYSTYGLPTIASRIQCTQLHKYYNSPQSSKTTFAKAKVKLNCKSTQNNIFESKFNKTAVLQVCNVILNYSKFLTELKQVGTYLVSYLFRYSPILNT